MSAAVKTRTTPVPIRTAQILTALVLVLAAVAAAGGIFLPHLYRGNAWVLSATRGQDVYTLAVAVPAMAVTWFAMDMGLVAPLTILAGISLWRRLPIGYLLSSCMLVKAATMGLALLAANWYAWVMGTTTDSIGWLLGYGFIGFGGLGMAVWFFRHCRSSLHSRSDTACSGGLAPRWSGSARPAESSQPWRKFSAARSPGSASRS